MRPRLEDIFNRAEQPLFVSCFSSSIHRMQQILDLSQEFGRKVAFVGRSMISVTEIAHDLGLLTIPDGILIRPQDVMDAPPNKLTVLISGTQGEPMSALSRVAVDNHKHVSIERGDTVVLSSRIIPGNEKAIFRMIDHMARRGADVLYGSMNPPLHVSGHGSVGRTETGAEPGAAALLRARSTANTGRWPSMRGWPSICATRAWKRPLCSNRADVWSSISHGARKGGGHGRPRLHRFRLASTKWCEDMVIRDRRHLSEDGIVLPIIAINKHTAEIEGLPEIVSRGFVVAGGRRRVHAGGAPGGRSRRSKTRMPGREDGDWGVMKEKIRADLKRFIVKQTSAPSADHAGHIGTVEP